LCRLRREAAGDFKCLVASLLSVQCLDRVALKACDSLMVGLEGRGGLIPSVVKSLSPDDVAEHISTVNYYKGKADKIVGCAVEIERIHRGRVPNGLDALQRLPGVGPKIARLVMSVGLGAGGCGLVVDTHVNRVSQRLGWAPTHLKGGGPEVTRKALEE